MMWKFKVSVEQQCPKVVKVKRCKVKVKQHKASRRIKERKGNPEVWVVKL